MQGYLTVKSLYNLLSVYANEEQKLLWLDRKEKCNDRKLHFFVIIFFSLVLQPYWWQINQKNEPGKIKITLYVVLVIHQAFPMHVFKYQLSSPQWNYGKQTEKILKKSLKSLKI